MEGTIRIIIYLVFVLSFIFNTFLSIINYRNKDAKIPESVKDVYDKEKYKNWKEYYMENFMFNRLTGSINFLVILILLAFGGFSYIEEITEKITDNQQVQVLLFLGIY